ncbi:MAG: hypothetical protein ACLSHU_04530 [Oscillospiraceae bacterium]
MQFSWQRWLWRVYFGVAKETTNGGTGASDETTPSSGEATVKLKEITVGIAQDLDDSP